jgi:uncharacterized sulfatase
VDLVPTLLSLLGVRPPDNLQGRAFLGKFVTEAPEYMFALRDRMDERYDMSRAVRDTRYTYIRNYMPQRPQGTYLEYMFQTPTTVVWKRLFDEGELNDTQSAFWTAKPAEELYDLEVDPEQIHNLADLAEHSATKQRLRSELNGWMIQSADLGLLPEGEVWNRAGEAAPYDITQNDQMFPVKDILDAAERASMSVDGDLNELFHYHQSPDSACRFWLASGLLLRAQLDKNRTTCVGMARRMSNDPSPYVRCLANETLARFGSGVDRQPAIDALLKMADARSEGYFAALMALNSLEWCQPDKQQIGLSLDGLPEMSGGLHQRYKTYIPRMIQRILHVDK